MIQKNFVVFTASAFLFLTVFFAPSLIASQDDSNKPSKTEVIQKTKKLQMPFIANNGQTDEKVKFYANTFGGTVFVTKDGEIVYSLPNNSPDVETQCLASLMHSPKGIQDNHLSDIMHPASWIVGRGSKFDFQNHTKSTSSDSKNLKSSNSKSVIQNLKSEISGITLREEFVGAKIKTIQGEEKSVTKVNYFKGKDPSKWKANISTYEAVTLGEIYDGIELKLKAYGNNVEKLFCVKPGADPEQIKISLSGVNPQKFPLKKGGGRGLSVNERGELEVETKLGSVKFTKPIAYQEINGKRVDVSVEYRIQQSELNPKSAIQNFEAEVSNPKSKIANRKLEYGFRVASYDKSYDLIIDPLLASTFLGGSRGDRGNSIVIDSGGNVYMTGFAGAGSDFPVTSGAYDTSYNGGYMDVFVSKLDGGLTSLLASTYLGGSADDYGYSLTLDTSGNVYVTGVTWSTDFPTTSGAYDTFYNGGSWVGDVFVSKLDSGLTNLLASTFLGGAENSEWGYSLTLDTSGDIYVMGHTNSTDFPTTSGVYDTSQNGDSDVFVSKLDGGLTSLLSSTFLGGSADDYGYSLTLDTSGNVYVTGNTYSTDFPTTSGAYDTSYNGGGYYYDDVFVSKLDGGLTSLLASTYLGGSSYDSGNSLTLDTSGNVYVTGTTSSTDFPTTSRAYDTSHNGGDDIFISKLNSGLTGLLASTYLGGSDMGWFGGTDWGQSLTLDTSGDVYVTGRTSSADFPTTSGSYDTSYNGGYWGGDVLVSKLNGGLTSLLASTYLGGSEDSEWGSSLTLDTSGNVYVTGYTTSTDFPTTSGAYDTSYNIVSDVFVSKLDGNLSSSLTPTPSPTPSSTPTPPTVTPSPTPTPTTTSIASFKVTKSDSSAFDIYIRDIKKTSGGFISAKITLINKTATWYLVTKEAKHISGDKKISDAFLFGREEHQYDSATSASERRLESKTWRNIIFTEGSSLKFSFDRNNITSYSALFIDMIGAGLLKVTLPIDALNMDDLQEFDVYNTEMETFINNLKENTWDQEFSKLIGLTWDVSKQVLKDLAKKRAKKKINWFIKAFESAGKAVTWILDLINLKKTGTILGYMGGWTLEAPIDAYVLIELPEDTISPLFNTEQGSQKD